MIIVNPDGTVHRHQKIGDEIVELEPIHNPDFVAPFDPLETAVDSIAYWIQSLRELGNPAEMVMRQGETAPILSDYIDHPQSRQTDRPLIDQDYARHIPESLPTSLQSAEYVFSYLLKSLTISGERGFDMAGKLLNHHLEMSGEIFEIPVDEMLADLLGLLRSVTDNVGFGLGERL